MAPTYELIASNTLTTSAASVTFSSIPATFTDLVLRFSALSSGAIFFNTWSIQFNNTGSVYSTTRLQGTGSAASSTRGDNQSQLRDMLAMRGTAGTSSIFSTGELYIPNYLSNSNKVARAFSEAENNSTSDRLLVTANLYRDTTPISTITFYSATNPYNIEAGSTFHLYGISNT